MHQRTPPHSEAEEFIRGAIDSVPHLEALLLVWTTRPRCWSAAEMGEKLYIEAGRAHDILSGLHRRGLLARNEQERRCFCYAEQSGEQDQLMAKLEHAYKTDLIRITRIIHSKAAPAVLDFAQAFRLKKE